MAVRIQESQGDPDCAICGGNGYVPIQEGDEEYERLKQTYGEHADAYLTSKRCDCLEEKRFRAKVGRPIFEADIIEQSTFEEIDGKNVFVSATGPDFLAHLRAYLRARPLTYSWKMITDMDLLDIFLGKREDWQSIGTFARYSDLLILRLGFQSYGNKSLPGQVLECLKTREYVGKTTWVINPHDMAFKEDKHYAWSHELEWYLRENYQFMELKKERVAKSPFGAPPSTTITKSNSQSGVGKEGSAAKFQDIKIF